MKPQSCRNCGKELWQNQTICPHCGREREHEDPA
ncbi:MAG: zinc-ribbon domain-containing protein [Nitrosopumilus sp.]|nr:zinc-ribbon domain-containing protein [Nitrosopumilus sp.]MCV0366845.1 zinc-ribbon domain-containing protein [Nitrosopumilus sp.]